MPEITYEENLEMFRRRNDPGIPNIDETNDISELEKIISLLREKQKATGEEYVIAEWTDSYRGPFHLEDDDTKLYGYDLMTRRKLREYVKKVGKEGKYWDPHIGSCWGIEGLEYLVGNLRNQQKRAPDTPTSLLEAEV